MPARKISAKEFAQDVRAGARPTALMEKYEISPMQLQKMVQKCVEAGVLSSADVVGLKDSSTEDVREPAHKPAETPVHARGADATRLPREEIPPPEPPLYEQEPVHTIVCPSCGKALPSHEAKCMYCGHSFDSRNLGIGEDSSSLSPAQLGLVLILGGILGMSLSMGFLWLGPVLGMFLTILGWLASFGCYLYGCGLYMKSKGYGLIGGLLGLLALPGLVIMYVLPERGHDL